jgi:peptidoglycan/LPS O-acetylase OafA/YrhL
MTSPNDTSKIPYRPYIDGLRGIAVIAVVLYHAKLLSVTGGFIGVDVFFVISGFLITSIIVRDLKAGTFSLLGFWERRARRILPALFVVMFCSIITAYFLILYPPDYQLFGKTVIAQSVFTSNMLFMLTDNYFDQASRTSPLLHTWSLSVEEQFYVLFPLIILLCVWLTRRSRVIPGLQSLWMRVRSSDPWEGRRILLATVFVLGIASFLLNIWFVDIAPNFVFKIPFFPDTVYWSTTYATAGFYLLATRAWELALGIFLSLYVIRIRSVILAEAVSLAGIIALGVSMFLFNDATAFPGVAALLPTLGAAAIIVANENTHTTTGKFLSYSLLVWIGLISYSLYLWHWPLFVFANLASATPLSKLSMAGLIVVAVIISWLSYRFIETPFRKKTIVPERKTLFLLATGAMALLALFGFFIEHYSFSLTGRIPPVAENILLTSAESIPWGAECFQELGDASQYDGLCKIGDPNKVLKPEFVVWGDSHAEMLVPLFEVLGLAYHGQGVVFDSTLCVPVIGVHQVPPAAGCEEEKASALRYIENNNIKNIILVARWNYYVMGGSSGDPAAFITDSNRASTSSAQAQMVFERSFIPMVQQLSREGRQIYIVEQVPEQPGFIVRNVFYRAVHLRQDVQLGGISMKDSEIYQAPTNSVMNSLATLLGVHVIDPSTILCKKGGICALENEEKVLYRDDNHLSTVGSMSLEPLFTPVFVSMGSEK